MTPDAPLEGDEPALSAGQTEGDGPVEGDGVTVGDALVGDDEPAPLVIRRRGRRVSTEPAPGYTGEPAQEPQQSSENDDRLRQDVPPHWG